MELLRESNGTRPKHKKKVLKWSDFEKKFKQEYISEAAQDQRRIQFENLTQGEMSVQEYEQRCNSLIRYAPYMLGNDELKAKKFFQGLKPVLRRYMATVDIRRYMVTVNIRSYRQVV